tara:strand:+ start:2781 stop:3098 length:318 start_codon:yes stop_codon:yes gene_type:complete
MSTIDNKQNKNPLKNALKETAVNFAETAVTLAYSKVTKYIIFLIFFLVILEIVNQIFFFFDLGGSIGYTYIVWFTVLFILFITLPINRSKLFNPDNKNTSTNQNP